MARTTVGIKVNNQAEPEKINAIISRVTKSYGYKEQVVNGEPAWIKGDGVIMKMQCFGVVYSQGEVVLQAWMKDAVTGESNLDGFVAIIPKKKMKKILDEIKQNILNAFG